nr:DUF2993 domain-containing protein [Streptomyces tsukubensis]
MRDETPPYGHDYGGLRDPSGANTYGNPYDELGALAGNPLDDVLREDPRGPDGLDGPFDPYEGERVGEEEWEPPNHRRGTRRRNRFAGLPLALKAVVAIVALAAFLALGDRWAVLYAEHEAADQLKKSMHLTAAPEVDIDGFPFVTQVAAKRLDSVKVTVPDVAADRVSLAKVSATATGIHIHGDLPSSLKGADVSDVHGEVLLSFDDLNRELGASQVTFSSQGSDRVLARGTLPVAGHNLRVRADARIQRSGDRAVATSIGGMRLDIGDLATYRPGTGPGEGLHLSQKSARNIRERTEKVKALFEVPAVVDRLGVPKSAVNRALHDENKLHKMAGTPRFARQLMKLNLIDVAMDHPELLQRLGLDPDLLGGLSELTKPKLADQLSLGFELPDLPTGDGDIRLRDVKVEKEGIRVDLAGQGLTFGK